MTLPRVLMCSMWKDDGWRSIGQRLRHLLDKAISYPALDWLWIVGDSHDDTAAILREQTAGRANVTVLDIGATGIKGDDPDSRLRRLSVTANHYLRYGDGYDYILVHESDLLTPPDLVNRLVARAQEGICPVAAWPIIKFHGVTYCYDVWALRKDGVRFKNHAPFHQAYQADRPFVVDSFGSVFMFHACDAPHVIMDKRAVLDLCWHLREEGRTLWVDPLIIAEQPTALWTFHKITKEYA